MKYYFCERPPRPRPVWWFVTPYDLARFSARELEIWPALCHRAGAHFVAADVWGTGQRPEAWYDEYTPEEEADVKRMMNELLAQPWCERLGAVGFSYSGTVALRLATWVPRERWAGAVVFYAGLSNRDEDVWRANGVPLLLDQAEYAFTMPSYVASSRVASSSATSSERRLFYWPRRRLTSERWLEIDPAAVQPPVLILAGWSDAYVRAAFRVWAAHPDRVRLVVGPWEHVYPDRSRWGGRWDWRREVVGWMKRPRAGLMYALREMCAWRWWRATGAERPQPKEWSGVVSGPVTVRRRSRPLLAHSSRRYTWEHSAQTWTGTFPLELWPLSSASDARAMVAGPIDIRWENLPPRGTQPTPPFWAYVVVQRGEVFALVAHALCHPGRREQRATAAGWWGQERDRWYLAFESVTFPWTWVAPAVAPTWRWRPGRMVIAAWGWTGLRPGRELRVTEPEWPELEWRSATHIIHVPSGESWDIRAGRDGTVTVRWESDDGVKQRVQGRAGAGAEVRWRYQVMDAAGQTVDAGRFASRQP